MDKLIQNSDNKTEKLICPVVELFDDSKASQINEEFNLVREEKYDMNSIFGSVYYFHHQQ